MFVKNYIKDLYQDSGVFDFNTGQREVDIIDELLSSDSINKLNLAENIAAKYRLKFIQKYDNELNPILFSLINLEKAKELEVFPYSMSDESIEILTTNPADIKKHQTLEFICNSRVDFTVTTQEIIDKALQNAEINIDQLTNATESFLHVEGGLVDSNDDKEESDSPIVTFINITLKTALNKRASDIHIECYERIITVKYRIDGQLYPATEALDVIYHGAFVSRLKVMAELDITERRVPQDGRFKLNLAGREIDFRLSVLPGMHGENVVIRVLDRSNASKDWDQLSLDNLGMTKTQLDRFRSLINEPYGMILITGPTGSGKTTTLYAALKEVNIGTEKIITIEDPVEYQLSGITQIAVNVKKGLTFAKGLRSILRHDPDKILVGEIRDSETADIAVQSALTGHLVFSSVHANNSMDVLARLNNMGVNVNNAMGALNAVMAQRLIRILCNCCKVEEVIDVTSNDLEEPLDNNVKVYKANGCADCNWTGYIGRKMISELLVITEKMRSTVLDGRNVYESISGAQFVGGEDLRRSALKKYLAGETSLLEVNRVTHNK